MANIVRLKRVPASVLQAEHRTLVGDCYEVTYDSGAIVQFYNDKYGNDWRRMDGILSDETVQKRVFESMMRKQSPLAQVATPSRYNHGQIEVRSIRKDQVPFEVLDAVEDHMKRLNERAAKRAVTAKLTEKAAKPKHARKMLAAWERKLQSAQRCVKKWKKKVAYYERKGE